MMLTIAATWTSETSVSVNPKSGVPPVVVVICDKSKQNDEPTSYRRRAAATATAATASRNPLVVEELGELTSSCQEGETTKKGVRETKMLKGYVIRHNPCVLLVPFGYATSLYTGTCQYCRVI